MTGQKVIFIGCLILDDDDEHSLDMYICVNDDLDTLFDFIKDIISLICVFYLVRLCQKGEQVIDVHWGLQ